MILDCGHTAPELDDLAIGDDVVCYECPRSQRSNESRTVTWTVAPVRRVVLP